MSKPKSPILTVSDLSYVREGNRILTNVSWNVNPGEHWAILGANGSGKTTLLKTLAGYEPPTRGSMSVLGEVYGESNWIELRKSIGIVSSSVRQQIPDHEPALITVISGKYAMIDYWGSIKRADRAEAMEILQRIDCEHLANRPWLVLSQGERQRILIGRALMAHPRLLILDEPCAGLDPVAREHFLEFIQRLTENKNSPAILLVTHHVEEIVEGISHVLILRKGEVLAAGKREETLTAENLGAAFGEKVTLTHRHNRVWLEVPPRLKHTQKRLFT